jgi:hypothetical protein
MNLLPFHGVAAERIQSLLVQERARYIQRHPRSQAFVTQAAAHLLFGEPLHWMHDCTWTMHRVHICNWNFTASF